MFFGYIHCPDVCPNTLGILSAALRRLENEHPRVLRDTQIAVVSIDPRGAPRRNWPNTFPATTSALSA